jgi:hypothetical protein
MGYGASQTFRAFRSRQAVKILFLASKEASDTAAALRSAPSTTPALRSRLLIASYRAKALIDQHFPRLQPFSRNAAKQQSMKPTPTRALNLIGVSVSTLYVHLLQQH